MTPKLFTSTSTAFTSNGIGLLTDAVSCAVTEERNGAFELTMEYPISGIHFSNIELRSIIIADANPALKAQPFRVYQITKPLNGIVTINAEHISYDLSGIPVKAFSATAAATALAGLKTNSAVTNPFTFATTKTTSASFAVLVPSSCRSLLGGQEGSILDVYGGEYGFDGYTVTLYANRGQNRGVTIRYGKNLTDLEQEENCQSVYTGVLPYYFKDGVSVVGNIVNASGTFDFTRIMPLDLTDKFEDTPTIAQLTTAATSYINANNIGVPRVSLAVSFVALEQSTEYKNLALLERVLLCDTVNVEFDKLGVSATAKVVKTEYDALVERYITIELGDARTNIADTIAEQQAEIERNNDLSFIEQAIQNATQLITGNQGGYVVLHSSTGGSTPDEILVMDTDDIQTATKVWRWNKSGLGYSSTGYNGSYGLAMTIDGSIVASFITSGTLNAALANVININASNITTGALQSANYAYTSGSFSDAGMRINMTNGLIRTPQFAIDTSGNAYFKGTITAGDIRSANYAYTSGFYSDSGVRINLDSGLVRTPYLYIAGSDGYTKFGGELDAVSGTFTTLTGTTNVKLVNTTITDNAISFNNTSAGLRMDLSLDPSNDRTLFSTNHNMALQAYTGSTFYAIQFFGSDFAFVNTTTNYNMHITVPNTAEASLVPYVAGKCNIGTNTYYFDYMHANHFTTHSLRKDKTNITNLSEDDYDIDAIRPITYTLKDRENDEPQIGLIAEELEQCCYKACSHDESGKLYGIDYSRLAVVAIKELQLLRKRVKELEDKTA